MPYDQDPKPNPKVSGSAPIQKPEEPVAPAPKEFKPSPEDPAIAHVAYALNELKDETDERRMTEGRQAGFSKSSVEEVLAAQAEQEK